MDVSALYGTCNNFTLTVDAVGYCGDTQQVTRNLRVCSPTTAPGSRPCMARVGQTQNSFTAFPNPTSGILQIAFENIANPVLAIQVSNNLGIQVLQNQNLTLDKDNSTAINLSNLADGIYFLTVSFADGSQETRKIMLQKGNIAD